MLKDKLDAIRTLARRLPDDAQALMQRSIDGVPVSLTELLAKGPVVLSFFRGRW